MELGLHRSTKLHKLLIFTLLLFLNASKIIQIDAFFIEKQNAKKKKQNDCKISF